MSRRVAWTLAAALAGAAWLGIATARAVKSLPASLDAASLEAWSGHAPARARVLARDGTVLSLTYARRWNRHDTRALHEVPQRLRGAFLLAEDRRFYQHGGVDWRARASALSQNLRAGRAVRGASTITEQAVRILNPRPRTLWSRWVESIEARRLEARFAKDDILEFYLDQVPYASNRRGVVQAARHYFDRDLDTLSTTEMLTLAVLVRAPSRFDPRRHPGVVRGRVHALAWRAHAAGMLDRAALDRVLAARLDTVSPALGLHAPHFVREVHEAAAAGGSATVRSTLAPALQRHLQAVLDRRLVDLSTRGVANGAVLAVEHASGAILAWVVAGNARDGHPGGAIDAVRAPRQPGSTLKPFVYALALEHGWTAATMIDDAPLAESVGRGLHEYQNYSRRHYGPLTLREALGNSLNIPAVKALQHVGAGAVLARLREAGVRSLEGHPDVYGDGLALGNGEVSLHELVEAYATLARAGLHRPLVHRPDPGPARRVFSPEVASLVGDILADPDARALEFDRGGVLRLPVRTAVKTGTSSDYRDAWAVGFDHRFTVGVWMGNLDRREMDRVTGSLGPALVLREAFARLNRASPPRDLYLSPKLVQRSICAHTGGAADGRCVERPEWFVPGTEPGRVPEGIAPVEVRIRHPSPGLELALDPRIPDEHERFRFALTEGPDYARVRWFVDGRLSAVTSEASWLWPLAPGTHTLAAEAEIAGIRGPMKTAAVAFVVKGRMAGQAAHPARTWSADAAPPADGGDREAGAE